MTQNKNMISNDIQWISYKDKKNIDICKTNIFKVTIDQNFNSIKSRYKQVLSDKELAKISRYHHLEDQERYIVSKYLLRCILSHFINIAPSEIQFHQHKNKKPYVDGIEYNVSHSKNYLLIAFSPNPIGIDIEYLNKDFDFESLLSDYFAPEECAFINSGKDSKLNFYHLWTRKEAILKASGEGLTDHLNQLNVLEDYIIRRNINYHLDSFLIDDNYMATLAASNDDSLNYWEYAFL